MVCEVRTAMDEQVAFSCVGDTGAVCGCDVLKVYAKPLEQLTTLGAEWFLRFTFLFWMLQQLHGHTLNLGTLAT